MSASTTVNIYPVYPVTTFTREELGKVYFFLKSNHYYDLMIYHLIQRDKRQCPYSLCSEVYGKYGYVIYSYMNISHLSKIAMEGKLDLPCGIFRAFVT